VQYKKYNEQKSRYKRLLKEYARQLLECDNWDYIKLKNVYDKKIPNNYAEYHIKKLSRQRNFQNMVNEEIDKYYKEAGITPETIINSEKELLSSCMENQDRTNWNKLLDKWRESIDLKPNKVQTTVKLTETSYRQMLETGEKGQIEGKQTKQIEVKGIENEEKTRENKK